MLDFRVQVVTWKGSIKSSVFNRQGSDASADPSTPASAPYHFSGKASKFAVHQLFGVFCGFCLFVLFAWVAFVVCFGFLGGLVFFLCFCLVVGFCLFVWFVAFFFLLWMEKDWVWGYLILFACLFQGVEGFFVQLECNWLKN